MCSAPNVYIFVYILIGTHMVPLNHQELAYLMVCLFKEKIIVGTVILKHPLT